MPQNKQIAGGFEHISNGARRVGRRSCFLAASVFAFMLASLATTIAHATTITVNSVADPNPGTTLCVLRDAITSANTEAAVNGCPAGSGTDTINFSVSGTIDLGSTLPTITNTSPSSLTIDGTGQSITIGGQEQYQVMAVATAATLNIANLTIVDGSNDGNGGGINNSGTLTVTDSTFADNFSNFGDGGGIYNTGTLTVTDSTVADNSAGGGGGVYNTGTLTVTHSTFAYNSTIGGGGINNTGGSVTLKATMLAGQVSGGNCSGTVGDGGYNLSDDATCDFSATGSQNNVPATSPIPNTGLNLDPSGLQNNGGPTQTIALEAGSVAIDAIPVASCQYVNVNPCTNPPTKSTSGPLVCDQRSDPRPSGAGCDVGAFELQSTFTDFTEFDTGLIVSPKQFAAGGSFTLGADAVFNPSKQAVSMTLASAAFGPLTVTIPPGHLTLVKGQYKYTGTLGGVKYGVSISAPVHGVYEFTFAVFGVDVTGITNPVSVTLQIGSNIGTDDVAAAIL